MVDPANLANVVINLTEEQISSKIISQAWNMVIAIIISIISFIFGTKIKNEIAKLISFILSFIGLLASIKFLFSILELIKMI